MSGLEEDHGYSARSASLAFSLLGVGTVVGGVVFGPLADRIGRGRAMAVASVAARISDHVTAERFAAAFGVATLSFGVGLVAGPQVGGLIGDAVGSFQFVFLMSAGAALVGAVLGWEDSGG